MNVEPSEVVHGDCCELEAALRCGDAERATELAKKLAEHKTKISVKISDNPVSPPEKPISINICIESRFASGVYVPMRVSSSTTFQTLSRMMYERFEFPLELQQWVAHKQKKIHTLNATLTNFNLCDGDTLHLYLLPATAFNVTRKKANETYLRAFHLPKQQFSRELSSQQLPATSVNRTENDLYISVHESGTAMLHSGTSNAEAFVNETIPAVASNSNVAGWPCPQCTYINEPTRPGCAMCSCARPEDYKVPDDYIPTVAERKRIENEQDILRQFEAERKANRDLLLYADQQPLMPNSEPFTCQICFDNIAAGEGVILRECLHTFCRDCLRGQIEVATNSAVGCPFNDGIYACESVLQEREIKALVPEVVYARLLALSVKEAESREGRSFHCQTPDCRGWCIYEDDVNVFECPVCKVTNCLTCKAQHVGETCRQYQDGLRARADIDQAAKQTQRIIERMLKKGNAMHCPVCQIVVMKKDGCDWIRCSMCKTEICWVTKGPRWGPAGEGDESGGCHCGQNGKLCHPNCQNCH